MCNEYHYLAREIDTWQRLKHDYSQVHAIQKLCDGQSSLIGKQDHGRSEPIIDANPEPVISGSVEKKIATVIQKAVSSKKNDIDFIWPVQKEKFWISSYFGMRTLPSGKRHFHNGIDLAALKGTPVNAAEGGIVERAYEDPRGYGKTIIIKHNEIYKTRYAHLNKMFVTKGKKVMQGQLIGHVGCTGNVRKTGRDASHLHFEVYKHEKRINPITFFR